MPGVVASVANRRTGLGMPLASNWILFFRRSEIASNLLADAHSKGSSIKKSISTALAAMLCAISLSAAAQQNAAYGSATMNSAKPAKDGMAMKGGMMMDMKMMDSNGDGSISRPEYNRHHAAMWTKMKKGKKGKKGMICLDDIATGGATQRNWRLGHKTRLRQRTATYILVGCSAAELVRQAGAASARAANEAFWVLASILITSPWALRCGTIPQAVLETTFSEGNNHEPRRTRHVRHA